MALDLSTIVLTGTFRRERHGHLVLVDRLPRVLPAKGDEGAREAWRRVVEAQARCIDRRAVDSSFEAAAGRLLLSLSRRATVYELVRALHRGPRDVVDGRSVWGGGSPFHSDADARRAYAELVEDDRAKLAGALNWSHWRFVRRCTAEVAFDRAQRHLWGRAPGWHPARAA